MRYFESNFTLVESRKRERRAHQPCRRYSTSCILCLARRTNLTIGKVRETVNGLAHSWIFLHFPACTFVLALLKNGERRRLTLATSSFLTSPGLFQFFVFPALFPHCSPNKYCTTFDNAVKKYRLFTTSQYTLEELHAHPYFWVFCSLYVRCGVEYSFTGLLHKSNHLKYAKNSVRFQLAR